MDYNKPRESGRRAFIKGAKREDNPVNCRTHANARLEWYRGWSEQSRVTCKGIKLDDGEYSGCTQTHGDCPVCGK